VNTPQPTHFHYQDLTIQVNPNVYDPAEDTYLLLTNIHPQPNTNALDLGTGCGIIALTCAHHGANVVATDINIQAIHNCQHNLQHNHTLLTGHIDIRHGDLFTVLQPTETFDLITFNPPYVPTPKGQTTDNWLDLATSGGEDGLQITTRFLAGVHRYLTTTGHAYFIASSRSPQHTLHRLFHEHHLQSMVVGTQRFEDEDILCYQLTPTD
jgi:release factor glutamine methyltransferase